jgi:hypothetical protein
MSTFCNPILIALGLILRVASAGIVPLLDFEKIQLSGKFLRPRVESQPLVDGECKAFPGEPSWPSETAWSELNVAVNGALLKPVPLASVCYNNTVYNDYSASQCASVSQAWGTTIDR